MGTLLDMYEILLDHIKELVPIEPQGARLIIDAFKPTQLRKKDYLLKKGDPSNHMRFIVDGCLKNYSVDEQGSEHILQFGISGWWVNDLYAFLTRKPSSFFIQAITNSTVLQIHRDRLNRLYDDVPMMDRFFRIKTQNGYVALQERTIQSMSQTAEQRYLAFTARYRNMEQIIPQYMVASYLGVTPEHLSAIRKNLSKKDRY